MHGEKCFRATVVPCSQRNRLAYSLYRPSLCISREWPAPVTASRKITHGAATARRRGANRCPCGNGRSAGHVPTEDFVDPCHEMGVETGYDLKKLIEAAAIAKRS